jgi:hypothetical protein
VSTTAIVDLLQASLAFARRTSQAISDWSAQEGRGAPQTAQALARLAEACASHLESEVSAEFARVLAGGAGDSDRVIGFNIRISALQQIAETVEQSTHRSLHPVLSPTVQSLLTELGVTGQVIVSGAREPANYELQFFGRQLFEPLADEKTLDNLSWPFLVFLVPRPPLDWPIHYTLLFHEIGHAVFKHNHLGSVFPIATPAEYMPGDPSNPSEYMRRYAMGQAFRGFAHDWLEEIYSDIFGLLSVGPTYLLIFCRVLGGAVSLAQCSKTHPPTALRIVIMAWIASSRSYFDDLPLGISQTIEGWVAKASDLYEVGKYAVPPDSPDLQPYVSALVSTMFPLILTVSEHVEETLQSNICTATSTKGGRAACRPNRPPQHTCCRG